MGRSSVLKVEVPQTGGIIVTGAVVEILTEYSQSSELWEQRKPVPRS